MLFNEKLSIESKPLRLGLEVQDRVEELAKELIGIAKGRSGRRNQKIRFSKNRRIYILNNRSIVI